MTGKQRNYLVCAALLMIILGVAGYLFAQRNDPVVRLGEAECQAAQRAYDDGMRDGVLRNIIRDCDRSGFPIRR